MDSDFLFARPSWLSGVARTLDLWGLYEEFNDSPTPEIADYRGLLCDWCMVGCDIVEAQGMMQAETSENEQERINV